MLHYKTDLLAHTHTLLLDSPEREFCMFCFAFNLGVMLIFMSCSAYTDWSMFSTCSFLFANKPSCWGAPKITQL